MYHTCIISLFPPGYVLDSCGGRVISNNYIYVDFSVIKYQCSCSIIFDSNGNSFYSLSKNPGYDGCGTAIQIKDMNNNIYSMPCTSLTPHTVFSLQFTTVELTCNNQIDSSCNNTGYCLRVFSNSRYCLLFKCYLKSLYVQTLNAFTYYAQFIIVHFINSFTTLHTLILRCFDKSLWVLPIRTPTFVIKRNNYYFNSERPNKFNSERSDTFNAKRYVKFDAEEHQPKRQYSDYNAKRIYIFSYVFNFFWFVAQQIELNASCYYLDYIFVSGFKYMNFIHRMYQYMFMFLDKNYRQ